MGGSVKLKRSRRPARCCRWSLNWTGHVWE